MKSCRFWSLLPLFLLYQLLLFALAWIPFVPRYVVLGLPLLTVNLVFALALLSPATRAWGRRMLLASAFLLALAVLYAFFPGLPVSAKSSVKLVGPEGGQVMTPDRMARVVVQPVSFPVPLLLKVTSLPLTAPLPGPALPPEVQLIAAARFEQSHPFPEEWQNFFLPEVQLSLKNAVAPVENSDHFTEICFWFPPEEGSPGMYGEWACRSYEVRSGDPTQKGSGWVAITIKGFGPEGITFYLFQYPRDWARAHCEAAGGRFYENVYGSFAAACGGDIDTRYYELSLGQVIYNPLGGGEPPPNRRQP